MIWDPGWKNSERSFLDEETLEANVQAITLQVSTILDNITALYWHTFSFEVINNLEFYEGVSYIKFLRDAWKYITVNSMMKKETVKKRLEDPDQSISYTEFSYMLMQWYDFLELFRKKACKLQIAGSDQRGNIVTGIELIRKIEEQEAYAATTPLILDSTGKKFWKSEWNAIWLDPKKNAPYVCYHYFMNATDEDVWRYLRLFTLLTIQDIENLIATHQENPSLRSWQKELAFRVTEIIFWTEAATESASIRTFLYEEENKIDFLASLDIKRLTNIHSALWNSEAIQTSTRILEIMVHSGLTDSNSDAKKLIKSGAIYLNENKVTDIWYETTQEDRIQGTLLLLRKWKKTFKTSITR